MDALTALKQCIKAQQKYVFLDSQNNETSGIQSAIKVRFPPQLEFNLDTLTNFQSETATPPQQTLKTIINCWELKDLSVAEYVSQSDERQIPTLKLLERTDLIEWLQDNITSSEYIKLTDSVSVDSKPADSLGQNQDVDLNGLQPLQDHNTVLHGLKPFDFGPLVAPSHKQIVNELKSGSSGSARPAHSSGNGGGGSTTSNNGLMPPLKPVKGKDPIILLSPSPSSLLNMSNVKSFLENSLFEPSLKNSSSPNLIRITRDSKSLNQRVKFVVVDGVENFKPEYWDRVVAVFVTGQPWQLKQYKWKEPHAIFQRVLGFSLMYKNDPVPETIKQWNIKVELLERTARFRDKEVVERIWERIEGYMIARGWPINT